MHRETLIAWLKDAHAMETGLIPVLQNHAKDARDNPDASSRITQHIQETRRHADLLSDCIRRLGEKPSGAKDLAGRVTGRAVEVLEDVRQIVGRDARSVVVDPDDHRTRMRGGTAYLLLTVTILVFGGFTLATFWAITNLVRPVAPITAPLAGAGIAAAAGAA